MYIILVYIYSIHILKYNTYIYIYIFIIYGCFLKWWYPQVIHVYMIFHYKPSIYPGTPIVGSSHIYIYIFIYLYIYVYILNIYI